MINKTLSLAYSPCPNDTFMFHDIARKEIVMPGFEFDIHIHDVETLNMMALGAGFDITKLSVFSYLRVQDDYELLSAGAALGYGCGPLCVARSEERIDIESAVVAVPGELTTAHLLFRLWAGNAKEVIFMPFDKIMDAVIGRKVDAGVIIHEGRFIYQKLGLKCLVDLGEWWQQKMDMPIPLGCIAAKRSLGTANIKVFDALLRRSIENAIAAPERTYDYVRSYAQELEEDVFLKHIHTYVNEFSIDIGEEGTAAIEAMEGLAAEKGML